MKFYKKAQIASVAMLATMGVAVTTAQADSLWVPLIVNTSGENLAIPGNGNYSTFLNIKMKGSGAANEDRLHYVWIKKGETTTDLRDLSKTCTIINNDGRGSKHDMIFQDTNRVGSYLPAVGGGINLFGVDASQPKSYSASDFVGMLVVTDMENEDDAHRAPEGDMSGFAYIVNDDTGDVTSLKLLNNHHSAAEGNMSAGFMSKKVVDFSWMSSIGAGLPGANRVGTGWTVSVATKEMHRHDAPFNNIYDATVKISQDTLAGQDSPLAISGGANIVYNNDEGNTSGPTGTDVTCVGQFTRNTLLNNDPQMMADTANGGWMRRSITPVVDDSYNKKATGAIIYRGDVFVDVAAGTFQTTMEVETSGHLAPGANHANRPY